MNELGVTDINHFLRVTTCYADFAEEYLRDPDDPDNPLRLEPGQRQAINALQFGYDIDSTPDHYINTAPPKGVVMIWPRQTGKTTAVAIFATVALILEKGVKIAVMAQKEDMAKEIIDRIKNVFRLSKLNSHIETSLKMEIYMKHGGILRGFPNSEAIRGYSHHYVLLDEAAMLDDDIVEGAAIHTARKIGKRWVMLSTPKGYKGILIRYYKQGLKTRTIICKKCLTEFTPAHFDNANFDPMFMATGLPPCFECGHSEPDTTDNDGRSQGNTYFYGMGDYSVISVDPFKCSFYPKDEIIQELEKGDWNPKLRQELLGQIITEGSGIFMKEWIDRSFDLTKKNIFKKIPMVNYIMGIDFGKVHDNSVIVVGHEDPKTKQAVVDYVKVILSRHHGKEYEDIKNDIIEVVKYFNPGTIVPDATGMGEPIVEALGKDLERVGWYGKIYCNKKSRLGFIFDVKSKPDLIENLQQYFARGRVIMPAITEPWMEFLVNELLSFSYEMTQTNYIKYGVQLEHDDSVIALALFVWGLRHKAWITPTAIFVPRGSL